MAGYLGTKAVLLSTTAANVVGNATIGGDLTVDTDTLYVDSTNNQVGIGTGSPEAILHVADGGAASDNFTAMISAYRPSLTFQDRSAGTTNDWEILVDTNDMAFLYGDATTGTKLANEAMRIDSSGHAIIPAGVTLGTAAGVYAAANTLDDYEEGTWTPVFSDASTAGTTAVATGGVRGLYTKVGNLVTINATASNMTTTGMTGANDLYIQGLPFTCVSLAGTPSTFWIGAARVAHTAFAGSVSAAIFDGSAYVRFSDSGSAVAVRQVTVADLTSGSADISFTLTYTTE